MHSMETHETYFNFISRFREMRFRKSKHFNSSPMFSRRKESIENSMYKKTFSRI